MVAIVNQTNYLRFNEGNDSFSILKASISRVTLNTGRGFILIAYAGSGGGPERAKIDYSSVSSPSTVTVTVLYNTIMGYL